MLELTAGGYLPEGIHDASIDDVRAAFGQFQETDRRPTLFSRLEQLFQQVRSESCVKFLLVDGSFVTKKPKPDDIDLIVVIDGAVLQKDEEDLTPGEANVLSAKRLRGKYGFDVFVSPAGSSTLEKQVALFSGIKHEDGTKGIVRLSW